MVMIIDIPLITQLMNNIKPQWGKLSPWISQDIDTMEEE